MRYHFLLIIVLSMLIIPTSLIRVNCDAGYTTHTFLENWSDTLFQLNVTSLDTWNLPDNYKVNITITILDMGPNKYMWINDIEISISPAGVENRTLVDKYLYENGDQYSIVLSIQMDSNFKYLKPGDKESYNLYIDIEGEIGTVFGSIPQYVLESYPIYVYAPPAPVEINVSIPEKIVLNDIFNIEVSLTNIGEYPISDVEITLFQPLGTTILGNDTFILKKLDPGSTRTVKFSLKASEPGDTYAHVIVSYTSINGYSVDSLTFPFCEKKVSFTINKIPSTIDISMKPETIYLGDVVTFNIRLNPPSKEFITLLFTRPDGSSFDKMILTNADGTYTYYFKPDMKGKWTLKAIWDGTLEVEGAEKVVSFNVLEKPSTSEGPVIGGLIFLLIIIVVIGGGLYYLKKRK